MPKRPLVHKPHGARTHQQRRQEFDQSRGTAAQRGYDAKWRRLRKEILNAEPLCRKCLEAEVTTAANEVDHIIAHKGDMKLFWDRGNLQPLCKSCHS